MLVEKVKFLTFKKMLDIEKKYIEHLGVNPHYLTYLTNMAFYVDLKDEKHWLDFVDNCQSGWFDTYEKKFESHPDVISASDPKKIKRLNELVTVLQLAANENQKGKAIIAYKEVSQICGRNIEV
jgi:hypothetical protein